MVVKKCLQVINLLLLITVLLFQFLDLLHQISSQVLQFGIEFASQFILHILDQIEQTRASVIARWLVHLFDQFDLVFQIVQTLVMVFRRVPHFLHVLVILLVVIVDIVLELQEYSHADFWLTFGCLAVEKM